MWGSSQVVCLDELFCLFRGVRPGIIGMNDQPAIRAYWKCPENLKKYLHRSGQSRMSLLSGARRQRRSLGCSTQLLTLLWRYFGLDCQGARPGKPLLLEVVAKPKPVLIQCDEQGWVVVSD
jgi:hypothetical protein